jgi:dUTPase
VFPVVGGTKISHLKSNIEALAVKLTPEDIKEIETGYDFDLGFPYNFLNLAGSAIEGPQNITILNSLGYFDYVAAPKAIGPHQGGLGEAWKE